MNDSSLNGNSLNGNSLNDSSMNHDPLNGNPLNGNPLNGNQMNDGAPGTPEKWGRGRRWFATSGAIVGVALLVGLGFYRPGNSRSLAGQGPPPLIMKHYVLDDGTRISVSQLGMPLSEERKAAILRRAKRIRAKWEPWARQHRALLRAMLHAPAHDRKAVDAVLAAIPRSPNRVPG